MGKILVIAPFNIFPPYWGAANRIYNIVNYLSKDHKVTLLYINRQQLNVIGKSDDPLLNSENVQVYRIGSFTKYSQILNPILILTGLLLISRGKYSLILAETAWSGLHAMILSFLTGVPYVLDEHNAEFVAFKRMDRGGKPGVFILKLYERLSCRFANKVFCVSDQDKDRIASGLNVQKEKIVLVPNGVDLGKFYSDKHKRDEMRRSLSVSEGTPLILFNGKLDYKPNFEAVKIILNEILPRVLNEFPGAKFLVVGNNPPLELSHDNLIYTGVVDRVEDYINASDVVICPLLSGGGTRLKILEAIACGKRVISTTVGAEGLVSKETKPYLKCKDNWDQFAQEVVHEIHNNGVLKTDVSLLEKYSWKRVVEILQSEIISGYCS
jgi:glycosyltransferase involved in cell wall biosynthesis